MIKSDRFDTTGLLSDPKVDAPHSRSTEDQKRGKYTSADDTQNGNDHCGVAGNDLVSGVDHASKGGVTPGSYMDRIDEIC